LLDLARFQPALLRFLTRKIVIPSGVEGSR
jgi:hypothetical protein